MMIRFFENWIVNFLISYCKNTHLNRFSIMLSCSSTRRASKTRFFIFSAYSTFEVNELLNFQRPFFQSIISLILVKKQLGSGQYKRKLEHQCFWKIPAKRQGKKYSFSETGKVVDVKCLMFGFLILHILNKHRVSFTAFAFNAKSFAIAILVCFFFSFSPSRHFFWTDCQKAF